jgi:hypothetical protein
MSNVPRGRTTEEGRPPADTTRWPVLARLPDASTDSLGGRFAKPGVSGGVEYRFDPPQSSDSSARTSASAQPAISQQPHIFERRPRGQRRIPRRDSSVLPRSNPFSNPRPRLVDSIAPAVRFLTMVALFTAAGLWIQMMGGHTSPTTRSIETPTTAAHPTVAPAKNANDHTVPAPTATGPLNSQPESGARVGRADGDDFASRDNSATGPILGGQPTVTPPHFLISAGSQVPRVRVDDATQTAAADGSGQGTAASPSNASNGESTDGTESDGTPAVARYPGFLMDIPTR